MRVLSLLWLALALSLSGVSATTWREAIPSTGVEAGDPNCQGDKKSPVNPNVNVPCRCPPTANAIADAVASATGGGATFPKGTDVESQIRRIEITLSAIQTLKCPASSTTLLGRLQSLTACRTNPNAGPQCSNPASTNGGSAGGTTAPANTAPSNGGGGGGAAAGAATDFRTLIPATGAAAGDPNCQGDKKSPVNPNINVPCRCPPTDTAIAQVVAMRTGNGATFPTGADRESQIKRFEITLSAIQTLKCPASSTTLLGRLQALTACRTNPSTAGC
ncbi:hypothetical protein BJ742DRAFT_833240 [Cladochytrium replicatum]|nr:hypothetical protein BJ742DRAFT_833240 [Cladochytrium replicatum]